jgi:hypothetical protein
VRSNGAEGLSFDFGNFKLEATQNLNRWFREIITPGGVMATDRTLLPSLFPEHRVSRYRIFFRRQKSMYCSTCGKPVTPGLSYCNQCGARLNGAKSRSGQAELFPDSLIWAIVSVFIVGFGCTIGLMAVMKDAQSFNPGMILSVTFLSLAIMLAIEGVLIWLLLSRRGSARVGAKPEAPGVTEGAATKELGPANARVLSQPAASVTEHTTRTLEPAYRERKVE